MIVWPGRIIPLSGSCARAAGFSAELSVRSAGGRKLAVSLFRRAIFPLCSVRSART